MAAIKVCSNAWKVLHLLIHTRSCTRLNPLARACVCVRVMRVAWAPRCKASTSVRDVVESALAQSLRALPSHTSRSAYEPCKFDVYAVFHTLLR